MKALLLFFILGTIHNTWAGPRVVGNGFLEDKEIPSNEVESNNKTITQDKINYPFEFDYRIAQTQWCSIDLVNNIDSFNIDSKKSKEHLYLRKINFLLEGNLCWDYEYKEKVCQSGEKLEYLAWTKVSYKQYGNTFDGVITHKGESTASGYLIKSIRGQQFLFLQHKSENYTRGGQTPNYYVFQPCSKIKNK